MQNRYYFTHPAACWNEAVPLGNGSLGAMVYGGIKTEKISLNHDTLWSGRPHNHGKSTAADAFYAARALTMSGKYAEATERIEQEFLSGGTARYLPFGDLLLEFDEPDAAAYVRELELDRAVHTVHFHANGAEHRRESFVSFPDNVLVMHITASGRATINFSLRLASPLQHTVHAVGDVLCLDGECPVGRETYPEEPTERGIAFRGGAAVDAVGGIVSVADGEISVRGSSSAVLVFSICTSFNGWNRCPQTEGREYKNALLDTIATARALGWDALLARHLADYRALYSQVSLDLGESGREGIPTDVRLAEFAENPDDNSLFALLFDFGRYLLIASSRAGSQPANLQGIWNDQLFPPWACGFTVNINLEMNYWPAMMCGLGECHEPLARFAQALREAGQFSAANDYRARGFMVHHATDIWAVTGSIRCPVRCAFFCGAAGWLCRNLYDYYEYTMDRNYLRDTCLPIMRDAAAFYLDVLCDRGDGMLSVVPQGSPENGFAYNDDGVIKTAGIARNAAMTDSIVYDLFTNCRKAMAELGEIDAEFDASIAAALDKMVPWRIASDGRIAEWNDSFIETDPHHRHISPLYALHPAGYIKVGTPEAEACRKLLDSRGDASTGWSVAWKANCFARLQDGNRALALLRLQMEPVAPEVTEISMHGGTYPNLFCAHPPFQIDGNFGAVSAITEMLITRDGTPLPALPEAWRSGSLCGVRIHGGRVADLIWENGRVKSLTVYDR